MSKSIESASIDDLSQQLMTRENVNGLALAYINGGKPEHVAAYGWRSVERNLRLTTNTIMYGASLTKTTFAYMVLQLVEEGQLRLDEPVPNLLPRLLPEYEAFSDLANDSRWRNLTPRILLTHTTGFSNYRWFEKDQKLRFHFDPGSLYAYSGEGFNLLQLILEQGLRLDVEKEMHARIFDRFGMKNTSMTWRTDFAKDLADGYCDDGSMEPHYQHSEISAAGSMDTSISDQAILWAAIVRGESLSPHLRTELIRPQIPIKSPHQFPTITTETTTRNDDIGLSAGLGLVTFTDTSGPAWFKGGHNDYTGNMVICLENEKRCLVLLSNDVRAERIYPELAKMVLGETKMPWLWEYNYKWIHDFY
jgi:CubicO group peptidase (beta-lactamase class C family)